MYIVKICKHIVYKSFIFGNFFESKYFLYIERYKKRENYMAVGARDRLDIALVKKYNSLKVDNPIVGESLIDPNKMYEAMNDWANMTKSFMDIKKTLQATCTKAIAPNITYRKTASLK